MTRSTLNPRKCLNQAVVADIAMPRSRKPAVGRQGTAASDRRQGKVRSRSQPKLFLLTFLVDTASAFLAKRLLGQVLAYGWAKRKYTMNGRK